jgi:hypothetical protein
MSDIYTLYEKHNFILTSGTFEPYIDEKNKLVKNFKHKTHSWKDAPKFNKNLNGQALLTGKRSGITAIDIDDPNLEHNKILMELCGKQCNLIQRTNKGYHYIFKYTNKIRTNTNEKLKIDVRNDDALLYIEPSNYMYKNNRYKYEFITLPTEEEDIKPITDEILTYYFSLFEIKDDKQLKIKELIRDTNKELKNIKINNTIDEQSIRIILDNLDIKRYDEYIHWIHLGIILKRCKISVDIYDEYSKKSSKYKENEAYNIYNSIDACKYDINLNTLYFWLKQDNKDKFNELMTRDNTEYENMKTEIEKEYIIIGSNFYKRLNNRKGFHILKENEIKLELKPYKIEVFSEEKNKKIKVDFYNKWIEEKGHYKFVDFIPDIEKCPQNTFNLFDGFEAEKHFHLIENYSLEQIEDKIDPFIKHIKYLTNNQPDYFVKWLAHIVQKPYSKEMTTPLFRDKGQFLTSGGGTGKNLFFDNFGEKVLGEKYYLTIGTNNELYSSFNEHLENKLLVCIEEAQGKSNFENFDRLKSIISQTKTTVNRKFVSKYQINDYSRYIFCSNNDNPIPIDNNDRRFFAYDVSTKKRGDENYFKKLSTAFNDNIAVACFLKYLLHFSTYNDPIEFQNNRPLNKTYVELKRTNAPLPVKWLISKIKKDIDSEFTSISDLFNDFNDWLENTRNKKSELTLNTFSRWLTSDNDIFTKEEIEKSKSSTMKIKLDYKKIKCKLIEKLYYDENIENWFID